MQGQLVYSLSLYAFGTSFQQQCRSLAQASALSACARCPQQWPTSPGSCSRLPGHGRHPDTISSSGPSSRKAGCFSAPSHPPAGLSLSSSPITCFSHVASGCCGDWALSSGCATTLSVWATCIFDITSMTFVSEGWLRDMAAGGRPLQYNQPAAWTALSAPSLLSGDLLATSLSRSSALNKP